MDKYSFDLFVKEKPKKDPKSIVKMILSFIAVSIISYVFLEWKIFENSSLKSRSAPELTSLKSVRTSDSSDFCKLLNIAASTPDAGQTETAVPPAPGAQPDAG